MNNCFKTAPTHPKKKPQLFKLTHQVRFLRFLRQNHPYHRPSLHRLLLRRAPLSSYLSSSFSFALQIKHFISIFSSLVRGIFLIRRTWSIWFLRLCCLWACASSCRLVSLGHKHLCFLNFAFVQQELHDFLRLPNVCLKRASRVNSRLDLLFLLGSL